MHIKARKNSVFRTIMLSYISILAIPLIIGVFSYSQAVSVAREDAKQYNIAALNQAMNTVDAQLDAVNRLMSNISLSSNIQHFLYKTAPLNEDTRYDMLGVIKEIAHYKGTNPFIDELYVYFKNTDIILKDSGLYYPHFFYQEEIAKNASIGYDEWMKHLTQYSYGSYLPSKLDNNGNEILVFRSLPLNAQFDSQVEASVGIVINEQNIIKLLSDIDVLNHGSTIILDADNNVIAEVGNSLAYASIKDVLSKISDKSGYFDKEIADVDSMIAYTVSNYSGWKYMAIIPRKTFMQKAEYIKELTMILSALSIVIGILMSYLMTRREYNPIKRILEKITAKFGDLPQGIGNEYDIIEEMLDKTISANESIEQELALQKPVLRHTFLSKLLHDELLEDDESIMETIAFLGINLPYDYYLVAVAHINNYFASNIQELNEDQRIKCSIIMYSLVNDLINDTGSEIVSNMVEEEGNEYILLFNMKKKESGIIDIIQEVHSLMEHNYGLTMSFYIGESHSGFSGIRQSYDEAKEAVEYGSFNSNHKILMYDDLLQSECDRSYYYPIEEEVKLINCVKAGERNKAERLINDIFARNLDNKMQVELIKCLFFDMASTAIKVASEMHIDYQDIVYENFPHMNACRAKEDILFMYDRMCELINQRKSSPTKKLCNDILLYIESNYTNTDICLTDIAQQFNMTVAYISHLFKTQMGIGIADYINRLRVEKAKELLKDSQLKLAEIAEIVGYTNDASFIRTFKKYEGVTPGQFRNASPIEKLIES